MKSLYITAAAVLFTLTATAQLYSSGNNTINGNNVGIGTNSPSKRLEINSNYDPNQPTCMNCPIPSKPGLRFSTSLVGAINPTTHYWDIDATQDLSINFKTNNGSFNEVMTMNEDDVKLKTDEAYLTNDVVARSNNGAAGSTASLSFASRYDAAANQWTTVGGNNIGSAIIARSGGGIEFITGISSQGSTEDALVIKSNGNVGIGVANPNDKLVIGDGDLRIDDGDLTVSEGRLVVGNGTQNNFEVNDDGYVVAREILVDVNEAIPDYVFDEQYPLMPLEQLKAYIAQHKHLPNIPSAAEYADKGGIEVGELSRLLLEKQEETLLYILDLEERLKKVESQKAE